MPFVNDMNSDDMVEELNRLGDLLPIYLCERTGLSMSQIVTVLDAIDAFWTAQTHVMSKMLILGVEVDDDQDDLSPEDGG